MLHRSRPQPPASASYLKLSVYLALVGPSLGFVPSSIVKPNSVSITEFESTQVSLKTSRGSILWDDNDDGGAQRRKNRSPLGISAKQLFRGDSQLKLWAKKKKGPKGIAADFLDDLENLDEIEENLVDPLAAAGEMAGDGDSSSIDSGLDEMLKKKEEKKRKREEQKALKQQQKAEKQARMEKKVAEKGPPSADSAGADTDGEDGDGDGSGAGSTALVDGADDQPVTDDSAAVDGSATGDGAQQQQAEGKGKAKGGKAKAKGKGGKWDSFMDDLDTIQEEGEGGDDEQNEDDSSEQQALATDSDEGDKEGDIADNADSADSDGDEDDSAWAMDPPDEEMNSDRGGGGVTDTVTAEERLRKSRPTGRVRFADDGAEGGGSGSDVFVRLQDVAVAYGNIEVLKEATWEVRTGQRVGLVGPNGSGKTTQLKLIASSIEEEIEKAALAAGKAPPPAAAGGGGGKEGAAEEERLTPTVGEVIKSKRGLKIAFLRQEFIEDLVGSRTLRAEMWSAFPTEFGMLEEMKTLEKDLETLSEGSGSSGGEQRGGGSGLKLDEVLLKMEEIREEMERKNVGAIDRQIDQVLTSVGFIIKSDKKAYTAADDATGTGTDIGVGEGGDGGLLVDAFSGGWKMRIGLAKVLLRQPDVLLLDEPTNHLDLESVEWLETFLTEGCGTLPMVVVSHDREFMDRVCNKIVDVNPVIGTTMTYDNCNYSKFLKMKEQRLASWETSYQNQEKWLKEERGWINRWRSNAARAQQVKSRQKALERYLKGSDYIKRPPSPQKPFRFRFPPSPRVPNGEVLVVEEMTHGYGERRPVPRPANAMANGANGVNGMATETSTETSHEQQGGGGGEQNHAMVSHQLLFDDVDLGIDSGDRIGIVGPNGCGKTTLLRLLAGAEEPSGGGVVGKTGDGVILNYFSQNQADSLDLELSVLETLKAAESEAFDFAVEQRKQDRDRYGGRVPSLDNTDDGGGSGGTNGYTYEQLRALLGQFKFKGDDVDKKVANLSGGEKARLALCKMMLRPCNVMLLDEPTNHLDIEAKEMMEEALAHYDGTVVLVSHDRYFLSQVANTILEVDSERKGFELYPGDYRYYLEKNDRLKDMVESRYVDGVGGIESMRFDPEKLRAAEDYTDSITGGGGGKGKGKGKGKKKNFGGKGGGAITSGRKDKGIKNAKRIVL